MKFFSKISCLLMLGISTHAFSASTLAQLLPNPMIDCSTSSNGYNFSSESRDVDLAQNQAILKCQSNSSTNNQECNANIYCGAY